MSGNGPPFSSKKVAAFTSEYRFDYITSSPRYPQSNGFIERMVQTVKQSMKKYGAAAHDPNLAMLIYRATPLTASIPSPAELLNGRKYRALLPIRSSIQSPHCQIIREQMVDAREVSTIIRLPEIYLHYHDTRGCTYKLTPSVTDGLQQPLPKRQYRLSRDRTVSKLKVEPN